jgi:beta-lactamase class A
MPDLTRRELLSAVTALAWAADARASQHAESALKDIQKRIGGRLGVHVLDSQSGRRFGLDENSHYAMASTFKVALAAALLWQVDRKAFTLDNRIHIDKSQLLLNSPAVEVKLMASADSMTVRELLAAVITQSDNAATNVLLRAIGGPSVVTQFFRTLGDNVSRLDRYELELNSNVANDARDTTTPRAMVDSLLAIFTRDVLSIASRALLIDWMTASKTGLDRVRAGLPKSWNTGDKSGNGDNGAINDIVITYPPSRRPIFIAVYMSESKLTVPELGAAHAEIGRIVAREKWK